jgi:elongation factor G
VIHAAPLERGQGFVFEDKTVGGSIPHEFIGAVEEGIKGAYENGVLAGYAMMDIKVELIDGSFHAVDSSEMAFRIAGAMAYRAAVAKADPVLLEPIMDVEVVTPPEYVGDVVGNLNGRRGQIGGMTQRQGAQLIGASVPLGEMFGYATTLRSLTQGRAAYSMQFSHYAEVPE